MHAYMITRGILHDSERFIKELSSKYVPMIGMNNMQIAVRPIQLWEVVFPEEDYDIVMSTLFHGVKDGLPPELDKFRWLVNLMRKKLGLEEPRDYKIDQQLALYDLNVQRTCIGIKKENYYINLATGEKSDVRKEGFVEGL